MPCRPLDRRLILIYDCIIRPERVPHFDIVRWQIEALSRRIPRDERVVQAEREVVLADVVWHAYYCR